MKRTVKAWIIRRPDGRLIGVPHRTQMLANVYRFGDEKVIPCTITYDDGKKVKKSK